MPSKRTIRAPIDPRSRRQDPAGLSDLAVTAALVAVSAALAALAVLGSIR